MSHQLTRGSLCLAVLCHPLTATAQGDIAAPSASPTTQNAVEFGEITISSAIPGIDQNIRDVQASIEVIDQQRMQALSLRSVPQILQYAVGLDVRDSGSTSSATIRGSASGHVLLLVDGLRRTGKYGNSDMIGLMVENIERIEIIRGPMSALYGADSLGGVINIITRKPDSHFRGGAYFMGGTTDHDQRDTIIGRGHIESGDLAGTRHRLSFEARERDAFRFNRKGLQTDLNNTSQKFLAYNGDWRIQTGKRLSWGMEYTNQDDTKIFFNGSRGFEKEDRAQGRIHYNDANESRVIDLSAGYGVSDTDVLRSGGGTSETTNYRQVEGNAFVTFFPLEHLVWTLGAGGRDQSIDVSVFREGRVNRTVFHGMTQAELSWGGFSLLGGLRYDNFSDFGGSLNPRVSASYMQGPFSLRVGYGHGFVAPSFTNQFITIERSASRPGFISTSLIHGNPGLRPEKGHTFEVSGAYNFERGKFEVTYHQTDYINLITSIQTSNVVRNGANICQSGTTIAGGQRRVLSCLEFLNVGKALIEGVEVVFNHQLFDWWRLFTSYEYLKTKDRQTGLRIPGRAADHTFRIQNIFFWKNNLTFSVNAFAQYDFYAQNSLRQNVLVNHANIDLKLDYFLSKQINLFAGVDNLVDRKLADGYYNFGSALDPGARFYYGGVGYRF